MNFEIANTSITDHDAFLQKSLIAVDAAFKNFAPLNESLLLSLSDHSLMTKKLQNLKNRFSTTVVVGIGGSSLGIQVLQDFFAIKNFIFIDNVDALEFSHQLAELSDLTKTLWLFISKSGETIETLASLELISQYYQEKAIPLTPNTIVITENKSSTLFKWAQKHDVLQFEIPLIVGGRFSILSSVGLVPASLMGLDLSAFEKGARTALASKSELVQFVAEVLNSFERNEFITILWSYSSRFKKFGFWWQQLWAESLGKKVNLTGGAASRASTPIPLVGATDQHSVLQQIAEGAKDKFVVFLRSEMAESGNMVIKNPQFEVCADLRSKSLGHLLCAEADATQMSFDALKISHVTLKVAQHNEETLGFLFMFFQLAVLALGEALEINPVNQPGVEHGKILCKQILADRVH